MRRMCRALILVIVAPVALLAAWRWWPRPPVLYRVTILPSLGGQVTYACAMNDHGQVVGYSEVSQGVHHLFLWDHGRGMRDLGIVACGPAYINNAGQIAGTMIDPNNQRQAFFWDPNTGVHPLGVLGGVSSEARAIDRRGRVAGIYTTADRVDHSFLWDRAAGMRSLDLPGGGQTRVWTMNDMGQVVVLGGGAAILLNVDGAAVRVECPLPILGLAEINNAAHAVGIARNAAGRFDVVAWDAQSGLRTLLALDAYSVENEPRINDADQVVVSNVGSGPIRLLGRKPLPRRSRCYLWDPVRGQMSLDPYIPTDAGEDFFVMGLNNHGAILGVIDSQRGHWSQAILLEPIPERWGK